MWNYLQQLLTAMFPNASEGDWSLRQDDGGEPYIERFNEEKLGPRPTDEQLAEAWPAVELAIKRQAKVASLWAWYEAVSDAGIETTGGGESFRLKAKEKDMFSISSLLTGEATDVDDPDTTTTNDSETILFDYYGVQRRLKIKDFKKVAIEYKNVLKGWNVTFALKLEEIYTSADPDAVIIPEA